MSFKPIWHYQLVDFGEPLQDIDHVLEQLSVATPMGGGRVRVLLDNRLNGGDLLVDRIELSRPGTDGVGWKGVTVGGCSQVRLAAGELRWSDPVTFPVVAGGHLVLRLWIRSLAGLQGMCQTWAAHTWQSAFARWDNVHDEPTTWLNSAELIDWLAADGSGSAAAIGISQVDVEANADTRTIALFGDSITHMSYFSDALAGRFSCEAPGRAAVINVGLAGNRLCYDATYVPDLGVRSAMFGPAGFLRFEPDLFGTMQPDVVLLMEGINDVTHCFQFGCPDQTPTIGEFCSHLAEVVGMAHAHGARIYLGTIMPQVLFAEEPWFRESERLRLGINEWILGQNLADGVVDFASVAESLLADASAFFIDGLHPNDRGGEEIAAVVPIEELVR